MAEFAAAELGVLLAGVPGDRGDPEPDALNLRHRHRLLWAAVQAGRVRAAQARAVTMETAGAGLTLAQARWVDEQTTGYLGSLSWGQVLALVEARIVAADPAGAEARRRAAALEQFVRTGRSTEHGLKTFIAKAAAGDVIVMVAMIDRIAGLLLLDSDTRPISLRRATAFGLLATRCAPSRCCRDTPPPPSPRRHPNHTTRTARRTTPTAATRPTATGSTAGPAARSRTPATKPTRTLAITRTSPWTTRAAVVVVGCRRTRGGRGG